MTRSSQIPLLNNLPAKEELGPGALVLYGFACPFEKSLQTDIAEISAEAPFRHMVTPGGFRMSVAMTNCGTLGWVTDRKGYRYQSQDPETGNQWPGMPVAFQRLATEAAAEAGYSNFQPDACLINRYEPGARLTLHQDRDEKDYSQPIVSVSLGLPAVFQFGGQTRSDKLRRVPLTHGDVVVWGGPTRLHYHGVLALKDGDHPFMGRYRINLTFRKAG